MVALRSAFGRDEAERDSQPELPRPNPADWLTLQQAACELNVSTSTARRMIRKGRLRNRIVPRPGGFAYLVYLPNSRHANGLGGHACAQLSPDDEHAPRDLLAFRQSRNGNGHAGTEDRVRALEEQVEHLSDALAQALKAKQRAAPAGMTRPVVNPDDPYARYRWLVRRKRWWPF
jgi:excisionase family DNA binding protein